MSIPNILLLLAFSAYYFVWYFSDKNGLTSQIGAAITVGKLPGIEERLRQVYTGIEALDTILVFLTTFFWTLVDGSQPGMMLHSITFCGALGSAWILVTLESWRRGNAWTTAAL
ncbi:hypothetical protein ISF_08858 [Cordyceps fumosorosea ARSEF 2679]|uniref:Uncharacterized protein n=1 Tax=Cordyceps fumosorosea (strain ARSEF 2679) TaxID=1081104 RepID=A0A167LLZ6_CORFA|nr:hypothetical protein ISF_08858 [Cordyceps fumosorosea ARSEF 2679]OAA53244.1 hypothetical protein ISF_08858 [Cordyceps fumosorosea ARSEF 2679]